MSYKVRFITLCVILAASALIALMSYTPTNGAKRKFIQQEHYRTHIDLQIFIFDTERELKAAIKKRHPATSTRNIMGFAIWNNVDTKCEIYVTRARRELDFETWGHELAHCIFGRFHE